MEYINVLYNNINNNIENELENIENVSPIALERLCEKFSRERNKFEDNLKKQIENTNVEEEANFWLITAVRTALKILH